VILLDTNLVSALMSQDAGVVAWLAGPALQSLWLPAVTVSPWPGARASRTAFGNGQLVTSATSRE
jgi:predicted nucleic acid-binding protein